MHLPQGHNGHSREADDLFSLRTSARRAVSMRKMKELCSATPGAKQSAKCPAWVLAASLPEVSSATRLRPPSSHSLDGSTLLAAAACLYTVRPCKHEEALPSISIPDDIPPNYYTPLSIANVHLPTLPLVQHPISHSQCRILRYSALSPSFQ